MLLVLVRKGVRVADERPTGPDVAEHRRTVEEAVLQLPISVPEEHMRLYAGTEPSHVRGHTRSDTRVVVGRILTRYPVPVLELAVRSTTEDVLFVLVHKGMRVPDERPPGPHAGGDLIGALVPELVLQVPVGVAVEQVLLVLVREPGRVRQHPPLGAPGVEHRCAGTGLPPV